MMTRAAAGGTKHGWLVDDLAAVVTDLRDTANDILRNLTLYQQERDELYLTAVALSSAELFQEIARITTVLAEMRQLIEASKPSRSEREQLQLLAQLEQRLAAMSAVVDCLRDEARHD